MWINFVIVAGYMVAMIMMGLHFSRRQRTTEAYFVAGRSMPSWAVGISIFMTVISSVTFIAYPGAGYEGKWSLMTPSLMMPLVLVFVAYVFIPVYRSVIKISTYEYIGKRFNTAIRVYSAVAFSLNNFAKMGFIFYVVTLSVHSLSGWNEYGIIIALGVVTVFYTLIGGLEAVIWTDVIQGFVMWVGAVIAIGYVLALSPGGTEAVLRIAWENHMFDLGSLDFDFSRPTLLVLLIIGFVSGIQKWGMDQTVVQRYLVVKSKRDALKGAVLGTACIIPTHIFFTLLGTCLWSFYQLTGESLPAQVVKSEEVFPYFLLTHIPVGLSGVVIAALMSAAMSTLSSDLNCIAAVGVEDCYRRIRPEATDAQQLRTGKNIVAVCGALGIGIAIFLLQTRETILSVWFTVASIVSAGVVGLFFLAFLSTRVNIRGIYCGIAACTLFTILATVSLGENNAFDLGFLATPIHSYMIGVIGNIIFIIVGYMASLGSKRESQESKELTLWWWLEKRKMNTQTLTPQAVVIETDRSV